MKTETPTQAFIDTKPHYNLLDGLRGVAAIMVLWYHIFEGYAFAEGRGIDTFNHGYLAVDFFFILSGFVISYAYEDRWHSSMTLG
ncbi:MAG: acyltransferase, partial [Bacteroidaceae bacterium]|nr:acyltransferase [Bacteroidaceae bacterium]